MSREKLSAVLAARLALSAHLVVVRNRLADGIAWFVPRVSLLASRVAGSPRETPDGSALALAVVSVASLQHWHGRALEAESQLAALLVPRQHDPAKFQRAIDELCYAAVIAERRARADQN